MSAFKRFLKKNSHNKILALLSRLGLSINRLYENRNYDPLSNGENFIIQKLARNKPSIILDVGANVGNYSNLIRESIPDATIHAFEPHPRLFSQLEARFNSDKTIICHSLGLADFSGEAELFLFDHHEHSSLVSIKGMNKKGLGTILTQFITGDKFFAEHQISAIDFLKVDVEGAEFKVIEGFKNAFDEKRIKVCQFEYGYANITSEDLLLNFYEFFEPRGYQIGKLYPKGVDFRKYHVRHEDFIGPNYIAVDNRCEALIKALSL